MAENQTVSEDREELASEETVNPEYACFFKAKRRGEPTFTLRAQDICADVFVAAWGHAQHFIKTRMDAGFTAQEAVNLLRDRMRIIVDSDFVSADVIADLPKAEGALKKAEEMRAWPIHKVAD